MLMPNRMPNWIWGLFITPMFVLAPSLALGQHLMWRNDYNSARKECEDKDRPMLLDFVTDNCFWCKKLDTITFQDPIVASLMRERFVLLKVDGEKNPQLAQALRIQAYPTMIVATADGRILAIIEGFVEPGKLLEQLRKAAPARPATPDWMARDFQEAEKAVKSGDFAKALPLLRKILEDDQYRPVQQQARQVLTGLELQAAGKLAHARALEKKGQLLDAYDAIVELTQKYAGVLAAKEAGELLTSLNSKSELNELLRVRRARELLAQARDEYRGQQYSGCLEKCDLIAANFADLPEGTEAAKLAAEIKSDPELLAKACCHLNERLGQMYLMLADSLIKKGNMDQAAACLERIQREFPGTTPAQLAEVKLKGLQGKQGLQTDFKKQP